MPGLVGRSSLIASPSSTGGQTGDPDRLHSALEAFLRVKKLDGVGFKPTKVLPNLDRQGRIRPGRVYEYVVPGPYGTTKVIGIRDDAGGDFYGPGNPQNRGPHFNTESGGHYDY